MRNSEPYAGIYIPIITPFDSKGSIDWPSLGMLIAYYARLGVAGFVPGGSTGEASTLSMDEHKAVISFVTQETRKHGNLKVIAATGSNSTDECVELTAHARQAGVDACLVVTPYYVRPNLSGLLSHYARVAAVGVDLLLYNIPTRTGLNLSVADIAALQSGVKGIVGIKEATPDIGQLTDLAHRYADSPEFSVMSGDDLLLFDCLAHGGRGSICAAALVFPEEILSLYSLLRDGRLDEARRLNRLLRPKVRTLFAETNPVPIKYALHRRFGIAPDVRLPLGPASAETRRLIDALRLTAPPVPSPVAAVG